MQKLGMELCQCPQALNISSLLRIDLHYEVINKKRFTLVQFVKLWTMFFSYVIKQNLKVNPCELELSYRHVYRYPLDGTIQRFFFLVEEEERPFRRPTSSCSHTYFFNRLDESPPKHSNMPLFLRTLASRAAPALRGHTVAQRASVYTKPAKEHIGAVVSQPYQIKQLDVSWTTGQLAAMYRPWLTRSKQAASFKCVDLVHNPTCKQST